MVLHPSCIVEPNNNYNKQMPRPHSYKSRCSWHVVGPGHLYFLIFFQASSGESNVQPRFKIIAFGVIRIKSVLCFLKCLTEVHLKEDKNEGKFWDGFEVSYFIQIIRCMHLFDESLLSINCLLSTVLGTGNTVLN